MSPHSFLDSLFGVICKLRGEHAWTPLETFHGDWFDVCQRCHAVRRHLPAKLKES